MAWGDEQSYRTKLECFDYELLQLESQQLLLNKQGPYNRNEGETIEWILVLLEINHK
jgi:hypothetical protein